MSFDKANLTAVGLNGETTIIHNPQDAPETPQKLLAIPFLLPVLFLVSLRKKGQTTMFMILGIVIILIGIFIIPPLLSSNVIFSQHTAESFSKSCFDSSVELMEGALSKQGVVPLRNGDGVFNVSVFLKDSIIQQPTITEARTEQEETLVKLYKQCINDYKSQTDVVQQEQNPTATIQHETTKTLYSLQPATRVTFSDESSTSFRTAYTRTTSYPYKSFHQTTTKSIMTMKDTGYVPLFNTEKTDMWSSRGKVYTLFEDKNENHYSFAMEVKN